MLPNDAQPDSTAGEGAVVDSASLHSRGSWLRSSSRACVWIMGAMATTLPKMVAKATSAASRPVPKRMKPMGMAVPDASNRYHLSPR